jgi:ribose transport system substrate-binding protein
MPRISPAKKLGTALGATALLAAAAACSSSGSSTSSGSPGSSSTASASYKIVFIPGDSNDAYYGSVGCGIKAAAAPSGSQVTIDTPQNFSPTDQIPVLKSAIATHPQMIIIAPTDPQALYAPLKQATAAGIKVVLVDTTLADPSIAAAQITSNNTLAGQDAAKAMIAAVGANTKGSVLTVNLTAGVTTTDARADGFQQGIKADSHLQYVGDQYTNNSVQTASSDVTSTLAAHPDLVGIFSTALFNTQGAVAALKSAHAQDRVKIVGFDGTPTGVASLKSGEVVAQVILEPYQEGLDAGQQAINALEGKPVTKKILTGAEIVTKTNLTAPAVQKYLYSYTCPAS